MENRVRRWYGTLEDFNYAVRSDLRAVLEDTTGDGRHSVPYSVTLYENTGVFWWVCYDSILALHTCTMSGILRILLLGVGEYFVFNPLFIHSMNILARQTLALSCSGHMKNLIRAICIPILGLWWPLWLLCCINLSLVVCAAVLALGVMLVYLAFLWQPNANTTRAREKRILLL